MKNRFIAKNISEFFISDPFTNPSIVMYLEQPELLTYLTLNLSTNRIFKSLLASKKFNQKITEKFKKLLLTKVENEIKCLREDARVIPEYVYLQHAVLDIKNTNKEDEEEKKNVKAEFNNEAYKVKRSYIAIFSLTNLVLGAGILLVSLGEKSGYFFIIAAIIFNIGFCCLAKVHLDQRRRVGRFLQNQINPGMEFFAISRNQLQVPLIEQDQLQDDLNDEEKTFVSPQ